MALRQLTTNLRSLKFGQDQLGGGNSNQPYIQTPLPTNYIDTPNIDAAFSQDVLIRGGALSAINSGKDLVRIGKFILDKTKGPFFILRQTGLQLSNPKIETGKTIGIENTRLYNLGLNTLAQIPVNAFGIHFDRAGLLPIIPDVNKYASVVDFKNKNDYKKNRLVELYSSKIIIDSTENILNTSINEKIENFENTLSRILGSTSISRKVSNKLNNLKKALNPSYFIIDDYVGGPGSIYGIGKTKINRYYFTENPRKNNYDVIDPVKVGYLSLVGGPSYFVQQYQFNGIDVNPNVIPNFVKQTQGVDKTEEIYKTVIEGTPGIPDSHLNSIAYNYDTLIKQKIADASEDFVGLIGKDFRQNINDQSRIKILANTDYKRYNMISRVGIGDPGNPYRNRTDISSIDETTQDKINMLPLFREEINDSGGGTIKSGPLQGKSTRDLIKFRFEAVDNDDPTSTIKIVFRAFIESFSDSLNGEWQANKYVGRGENFYVYQGFSRQVGINFKIAAQSRSEMKPLYQKLNYLLSNVAPDYQQNGFMRGNFLLLTMGNWFYKQPIIINNINPGFKENYPWEIAMSRPEDEETDGPDINMTELPQIIDVSMGITLIHNFIPRKGATIPFINTGHLESNNWLKRSEFNRNIL